MVIMTRACRDGMRRMEAIHLSREITGGEDGLPVYPVSMVGIGSRVPMYRLPARLWASLGHAYFELRSQMRNGLAKIRQTNLPRGHVCS